MSCCFKKKKKKKRGKRDATFGDRELPQIVISQVSDNIVDQLKRQNRAAFFIRVMETVRRARGVCTE